MKVKSPQRTHICFLFVCGLLFSGCKKFLDQKQDQSLLVPSKIADLQALLDDQQLINYSDISLAETAADNYYYTQQDFESLPENERALYTWNAGQVVTGGNSSPWTVMYIKVYRANVVLDGLKKLENEPKADLDNVKGQALFLRAKSFLQLASIFSLAFDEASADHDLGIPLRIDPNFNRLSSRSTVRQTYNQIIFDFKQAAHLLPLKPLHPLRSSKAAAYGMLSRTYLFMRKYEDAELYADSCLQIDNALLDYNVPAPGQYDPEAAYPFTMFNPEVIYQETMEYSYSMYYGNVDSALYNSYADGDLRKTVWFLPDGKGPAVFKGDYNGIDGVYAGLTTDEIWLNRAECLARRGDITGAMSDLNALLVKRWKNDGSFTPYAAASAEDALAIILAERRKELVFRRLRWMDIKRLNKEGNGITLKRHINGTTYVLPPNDLRYALLIPADIIQTSEMPQNPR